VLHNYIHTCSSVTRQNETSGKLVEPISAFDFDFFDFFDFVLPGLAVSEVFVLSPSAADEVFCCVIVSWSPCNSVEMLTPTAAGNTAKWCPDTV